MNNAIRRRIACLVARADTAAGMDKLEAWIEVYAERARGELDVERGELDVERGELDGRVLARPRWLR